MSLRPPTQGTPSTATFESRIASAESGSVGLVVSVTDATYGATGDGVTDDSTAIQAAITAVSATSGVVYFPAGTYRVATRIALKDNVTLRGAGLNFSTIKAMAGVSTSVLIGVSGDTVSDVVIEDLCIDADYTGSALAINAIQITTGSRIRIDRCKITNASRAGVLLQTACADCRVDRSYITNCGMGDETLGPGIKYLDSVRGQFSGNNISVKGFGIVYDTSTDGVIANNVITQLASTTGFEAIGLTTGSSRVAITGNAIYESQDNGISVTGSQNTVTGNVIYGALNHGVASAGNDNVIVGNLIRDVGKENAAGGFAGVALTACTNNIVVGNLIVDRQGSPTMQYGIKENTSAGGHQYQGNRVSGFNTQGFSFLSNTSAYHAANGVTTQSYSASITVDAASSRRKKITATNGTAFTINAPLNPYPDAELTFDVANGSGGVMGAITWNAVYKLAGAFTNPADTKRRTIRFYYDGTNWVELGRAAADI